MVSASGSETSVWSSTPTSAIIYDAYTSIIKAKKKNKITAHKQSIADSSIARRSALNRKAISFMTSIVYMYCPLLA